MRVQGWQLWDQWQEAVRFPREWFLARSWLVEEALHPRLHLRLALLWASSCL